MKDDKTLDGRTFGDYLVSLTGRSEVCRQCVAETAPVPDWILWTDPDRARDTEPPPPDLSRWPTLAAIGLGDALDAMERVTTWAQQGKHRGKKWETQTKDHQIGKLLGHLAAGMKGEQVDEETGEHPYAHTAVRALMLLGIALQEGER